MANPVTVSCTQNEWQIVALNVTAGNVKRLISSPNKYLETYRMTGNPAPTSRAEGIPIFLNGVSEVIESAAAIDVYIMAIGADGSVRVDLP